MAFTSCNRCDRFIDTDDGEFQTDPDELGKFICSECEAKIQARETEIEDNEPERTLLNAVYAQSVQIQ